MLIVLLSQIHGCHTCHHFKYSEQHRMDRNDKGIVFVSPVWLVVCLFFGRTENQTSPPLFSNSKRLDQTNVDQSLLVFCGPWTGFNSWYNWSFGKIIKLWIGRFIDLHLSFNTSLQTLIYVENWCSYENILVHLLFLSVFSSI